MPDDDELSAARPRARESRLHADRASVRAEAAQRRSDALRAPADDDATGAERHRPGPMWWLCGLLGVCLLAVSTIAVVSAVGHTSGDTAKQRAAEAVSTARTAVTHLVSVDAAQPDDYVDQVLDDATGAWKSEFLERRDSVVEVLGGATSTTVARVVDAGFEHWAPDNSGSVLVVVQTGPKDGATAPDTSEGASRSLRIRVAVTSVDGEQKLSKVEFVS